MNGLVNTTQPCPLTMSSLEIAAYTGKRHLHILRDIRKMLADLGEGETKFGSTYIDAQGKAHPAFNLPKRETLILVSGYSVQVRARIIDRWQELEAAVSAATSQMGVVAEIDGEMRRVIGGILKRVLRSELSATVPALVQAELAAQNLAIRRGRTAGQIWKACGLPKLKNGARWLGNRLAEMGCCIENGGRGELGEVRARLFDPDKADVCLRNGLLHQAKIYVAERLGQGSLRLVPGGAA